MTEKSQTFAEEIPKPNVYINNEHVFVSRLNDIVYVRGENLPAQPGTGFKQEHLQLLADTLDEIMADIIDEEDFAAFKAKQEEK